MVANELSSTQQIVKVIQSIPAGKVSSYRDVALAAGLRNGARQTVRVLHSLSQKEHLPWHRVIKVDGHIALPYEGGRELQIALLRSEGVEVSEQGLVDMQRYGWTREPSHRQP
ncbi:MAG: MGMT family protein [Treponema sp.]|jgi:methylated-DNA-protein-cysteine methyltransferase-like protein|nr:MGMT family protein [Treponema sp.]